SLLGSTSIYYIYLQYLVYLRFNSCILSLAKLSLLWTVIFLIYIINIIITNITGLQNLQQYITCAVYLSLINLCLLFLSSGREFGIYLLGISQETYSIVHCITGFIAGI
ncbi:hypothetical protein P170DRAFT_343437, partial [Aspergillus steynii IBT 23096]